MEIFDFTADHDVSKPPRKMGVSRESQHLAKARSERAVLSLRMPGWWCRNRERRENINLRQQATSRRVRG
jgi:hypothetical protein